MAPTAPPAPQPAAAADSTPPTFALAGRILRKKNVSARYLKLALLPADAEKSTDVFVPRTEDEAVCTPSEFNFLHVDAVIEVRGRVHLNERGAAYHHVETCELIKCAPNVKLIREVLALPHRLKYAPYFNMEEGELQALMEGQSDVNGAQSNAEASPEATAKGTSHKAIVNAIIERLTGKAAKAPPKYRPGRVRREDVEALQRKELEGCDGGKGGRGCSMWTLCRPCRSLDNSSEREAETPANGEATTASPFGGNEAVLNLPDGARHSLSAHGKLTRGQYLSSKKNRQAAWFISRIRQFAKRPARFLDVGGGRGDLAVQLALHFPEARVVVVDCNESSVEAGKEYVRKCGVEDRIEFVCADFAEYVATYNSDPTSGERVDCVVALHACGDLSDLALRFCSRHSIRNFVICPCCYVKRYIGSFEPHWHSLCSEKEIDSLARLVELDDHREVSHRAMIAVNCMRKSEFEEGAVVLEEFDERISKRNVVLVGGG